MKISISKQRTVPSGVVLTIHAASNKQQATRILINKNFARAVDADSWYLKNQKSIITHLMKIEEICTPS